MNTDRRGNQKKIDIAGYSILDIEKVNPNILTLPVLSHPWTPAITMTYGFDALRYLDFTPIKWVHFIGVDPC